MNLHNEQKNNVLDMVNHNSKSHMIRTLNKYHSLHNQRERVVFTECNCLALRPFHNLWGCVRIPIYTLPYGW